MRFLVNKSSQGAVSKSPPCKGAIRGPEASACPGEYQWFLEVDTLEGLISLLNETGGGLGLFSPEEDEEHPVIEIFDEDQDE
jgi:hypothetical protein